MVKDDMAPCVVTVREPIPLLKRVCIALYKLATCAEYRGVAKAFGVSITTVHRCLHKFCRAKCSRKMDIICWYTDEEAAVLADTVEEKYGYPQCIGAIDGTDTPITPPADGFSDFVSRKGYPSIVMQCVVDGNYMFRDTYANTPGAAHDASVFRLTKWILQYSNQNLLWTLLWRMGMLNEYELRLEIMSAKLYP